MGFQDIRTVFVESLGHIKESPGGISMVCDYHRLSCCFLTYRVIEVATSISTETLLPGFKNNDSYFTFGLQLVINGFVKYGLCSVQLEGFNLAFFSSYFEGRLRVELKISQQFLPYFLQLLVHHGDALLQLTMMQGNLLLVRQIHQTWRQVYFQ